MAEELVLLTRLADLLGWLLPKSEKFPKSYRFTLTQRMMDAALDCQEAVFAAQSHRAEARKAPERALSALLFQDPPRTTRATTQGTPQSCNLRE